MRDRAPPRSAGLLNGDYDKHGGKIARYNGGTLARAAAAVAILAVWLVAMYAFSPASGEGEAMTTSSLGLEWGEAVARDSKKKHKHEDKGSKHKHHSHKHKQAGCTASPLQEKDAFPVYGCAELEEMLEGKTEFLGKGYWREVRLATYQGQDVAIKTLREDQEETDRNKERHRWEAVALDMVSDHPNIVHLLGLCECDMVTEYFPYYMDVLLMGDDSSSSEELVDLSIGEIIRMALQASRGIQALHEMPGGPVVHADLQPRQLLLDEKGVVKVNDLNRCRFMARDSSGEPCPFYISKGNGVWRSPEEYAGESLTEKLDIYSLGNIFWAMLGRKPPFARDNKYKERVLGGERPMVDPSWHPEFVQLFTDMWKRDPRERPTAQEVVLRLEAMYAELPPESESD